MHKFKSLFSGTLIQFFDESRPMHSAASSLSQHEFSYVKSEMVSVCFRLWEHIQTEFSLALRVRPLQ